MLKKVAFVLVLSGLSLHFYTAAFESSAGMNLFSLTLMFFSWLPYLFCLMLIFVIKNEKMMLGAVSLPFIMDWLIYYNVFISPQGNQAALALLWMPLWNLVVFIPVGLLIGLALSKLKNRASNKPLKSGTPQNGAP